MRIYSLEYTEKYNLEKENSVGSRDKNVSFNNFFRA